MNLLKTIDQQPIVPYIRESEFAVRKPWYVPERRLLDYLLIFVHEGTCVFHVEGTDYIFRDGEFCLIQPNQLNTLRGSTHSVTPFAHMDFFYHPHRDQSFMTGPGQVDLTSFRHLMQPRLNDFEQMQIPVKLEIKQPIRFGETMLKMVEKWQHPDVISQLEAQHLATELILTIIRDHKGNKQQTPIPRSLNWIPSYLSLHLSEPVSIADMARRAGLSSSRFTAVFKKQFGLSPHQYLLRMRVQHAQELLKTTSLTLEQIADYCGFADIHHFSKTFKRMVKETPGRYRHVHHPGYL